MPGVGTAPPLSMRTNEFTQSRRHGAAAGAGNKGGHGMDESMEGAIDMAQMSDVVSAHKHKHAQTNKQTKLETKRKAANSNSTSVK